MTEDINKIVEQLESYPQKEGLPDIAPDLSTEGRIALLDDNWEIVIRGADGKRRNSMISQGEAAWIVKLARGYHADIEFLLHFKNKKGDIPYSSTNLGNLFSKYLNYFINNSNSSESTEVPTLKRAYGSLINISSANLTEGPDDYLRIKVPSQPLDQRITDALMTIGKDPEYSVADVDLSKFATAIEKVTQRFGKENYLNRLILKETPLYMKLLVDLLYEDGEESEQGRELLYDTLGFANSIVRNLIPVRHALIKEIADSVVTDNKIELTDYELEVLVNNIEAVGVTYSPKSIEPAIIKIHNSLIKEGGLGEFVEFYIKRNEIKQEKFTYDIKRRMVSHLLDTGVNITDENKFNNGGYDEYFALAYNNATSSSESTMYGSPTAGGWDFSVDTFDEVVDQAIIRENILAVGFLDYAYQLGNKAHIFQMMDVLYLNWNRGILDLPQSEVTDTLERLWQERERRNTPEERTMSYKKTLGRGDVQVLDRMIVNEHFDDLWSTLMEEVANYIRKSEEISVVGDGAAPVSRIPIYQATIELQYNLTEYGNGRTKTQAAQLHSLLNTCFSVLDAPEIIDFYGFGTRRDRWTVIDRLHKEPPFESVPNLSALKTLAGKGNKVFQWIANFNEASVSDEDFETLIRSAEAWIIAKSAVPQDEDNHFEDDEDFDDFEDDEEFDDFDD